MRNWALALLLLLSGCNTILPHSAMVADPSAGWRRVATAADRERLREWRKSFVEALAAARKGGHRTGLDAQGALLEPDAALPAPAIPNGTYQCRVIKLGAKSEGMLDYVAYPAFTCVVTPDGALQRLTKATGSQRYVGLIFPGDALKQVFLGTVVLGDEPWALQYGQDQTRDVAGYIERVGPARWRLVMPRPYFESQLDIMELVPNSAGANR